MNGANANSIGTASTIRTILSLELSPRHPDLQRFSLPPRFTTHVLFSSLNPHSF
jgi:hypothetical protein